MMRLVLGGCTSEPLSNYLKSLSILRLIGEQKDDQARGWWADNIFCLDSCLDEDSLLKFLFEQYKPTPIVAPWNGGSGFYHGDNRTELDAILKDTSDRMKDFKETIESVERIMEEIGKPASGSTKENKAWRDEHKNEIMQACRDSLGPKFVEWMDSSVIMTADGKPVFPPLFGTGGNEGRLDYSSTFMFNLEQLLMDAGNAELSKKLLRNSILGEPVDGFSVSKMGQFDPGHSGGYNQGFGVEQKEFPSNPWDFVLLMEGAVLWASSIGRRQGIGMRGFLRSPFTVRVKAVGYSSSVSGDEQRARAEIWAPLWNKPLGVTELRQFIAEGRADVGRHRMARNGIEFAEAATSLGVDRGIKEFTRYSLLKRRGDSYVALPLGRFPVKARRESDLIQELNPMLERLDWLSKEAPAEYTGARHQIDISLFETLLRGGASRLAALIVALGRMEKILAIRDHSKKPTIQPPNGLSPKWLLFADDGSVEFRIAAAIASIGPTGDVGPIRANLEPVDPMRPWRWSPHGEQNAWAGHSLSARFANVLARRMMDAERLKCERNPLQATLSLSPRDIGCFIEGKVDDGMIENLLFGMMWIRWNDRGKLRPVQEELEQRWFKHESSEPISRSWALLKLLFLPEEIRLDGTDSVHIVPESAIIPTLKAGRIGDACRIAQRRLYSSGLFPIRSNFPNREDGIRLAASLLLPVRSHRMMIKLALVEERK